MPDPVPNQQIEDVSVMELIVKDRLRPVDLAAVEALQASVEEIGALTDAIHVRRTAEGDVLIDGAHRVALAMSLGWETIPARVWRCNDLQARLMEVDAGIAGAELNHLDLALFLAERKRVYEELHPETKHGMAGAISRWDDASATMASAFSDQISKSRDMSQRTVQRLVRIGSRLSRDDVEALRFIDGGVKLKDLEGLAKIGENDLRGLVIGSLSDGSAKSVRDGLALHKADAKPPEKSNGEKRFQALRAAWHGAPKLSRTRFLKEFQSQLQSELDAIESDDHSDAVIPLRRGVTK